MSVETVQFAIVSNGPTLTLNRPLVINALHERMRAEITQA